MSEEQNAIAQMRAITISREYGSGGGEIAARLAHKLGWRLVDHEVVVRVARELGVSEADAEEHDERSVSLFSRILISMQSIQPPVYVEASTAPILLTNEYDYRNALNKVVTAAVDSGNVVIVGRGSQMLLAQRRDVLHVRIVASLERRIQYVMSREGLAQDAARSRIQAKDRDRARYLQAEYQRDPSDARLYDLVVNTNVIDLDSAVDLINLALERKAQRLPVTTGELGPVVGLPRYPTQPQDLRPPENPTK
ncbi:MAG TPA: cytidylate kinase-like family protein [Ktedonobacteraceae bacterium]|nr:cytidylate kinase-like family protein [Ktedonobacteraceae bacterium]